MNFLYLYFALSSLAIHRIRADHTLVDILVADYTKTEQHLWTMIENRADNVLLHVYKTHENFFNRTISESSSGVMMRELVPSIDDVIQVAVNLNSTAELGYNHLREQELDRKTITDYANYSLKILKDASDLVDLTLSTTFWDKIVGHFVECHRTSETVEAAHQIVYDFYRDIQSGLLKSYITSQMSYMILAYYNSNGKSYREESDILRNTFETRFKRVRNIAHQYIQTARKEVWRCDAEKNAANIWHTEVTNFMQGIVDNEANLNEDRSCAATCSVYQETQHFQCQSGSLCDPEVNNHDAVKCNGVMRHCQEIDDSDVTICEIADNNRHYNHIKYSDGRVAGDNKAQCHGRLQASSWLRWFVRCSNCICLCDDTDNKKSDRIFSLRPVESNIGDNKIVTGVMFTKQNGIIQLAISERTLLPFGQAEVLPPYPFVDTWRGVTEFFSIGEDDVRLGIDYHALSYENRSINLDHVTAPKDHIVTGVRFRIIDARITLEIRATEFDFVSGRLRNQDKSIWLSNPDCGQVKIEPLKRTNPMKTNRMSVADQTPNGFIEFGPTDFWSDVSQLTVPFIDTQRVESYTPVALSGIGIYYKTIDASGGFIAPKLFVYDFESHLSD